MKDEIKRRWIAKLESGEYPQTKSVLADDSGYCCLGVLCEVAVEDGIVFKKEDPDRVWYTSKLDDSDTEGAVLPFAVRDWAGLPNINPEVPHTDEDGDSIIESLAELNDRDMPFSQIANLIEQNF